MRRTKLAVGLSVIALLTAAACGGPPGKDDTGAAERTQHKDKSPIGGTMKADEKAPAAPIKGAKKGGKLTVYSSSAPDNFDPTRIYYTDSGAISKLTFRTLTQYKHIDGKMVLVPDMATDLGRPNKDFTRWEFTLRDGLKYENGRAVKSQDVAYAIKRQFAQEELPGGPTYGLDYFLDGDKYLGPYKPAKKNADGEYGGDNFRAVETPDDKTIVIKMRKPFADLRFYATYPTFTPIPEDADTKSEYQAKPLATGPYKFKSYKTGIRLVLERNPEWDPNTDTTRRQYVDEFDFRFGQEDAIRQRQVLADKGADKNAIVVSDLLSEVYAEIKAQGELDRLMRGRARCVDFAYFDTRKIPLEVRRAAATAWPIENEVKVKGQIPGVNWSPSTNLMPSLTPGWSEYDAVGNKGKGNGDPKKAKEMLKKAGEENFELIIPYQTDDPQSTKTSQARKSGLEKAGFKVRLIGVNTTQFRSLLDDKDAEINVRPVGWCPDWPSGAAVFPPVWDPRKVPAPQMPAYLKEPKIAEEIDRISALPPEKGLPAWNELGKMIMEDYMPAAILGESDVAMLRGSNVKGVIDEAKSMPYYSGISLKQ